MKLLIISVVIAWLIGKAIKLIIDIVKEKRFYLKQIFYDGGMPSSHTVAVVSLTTAMFLETGLSYLFAICIVLALIIMNDAQSVRLITTNQSKIINKLIKGKNMTPVKERVGHTPLEVFAGLVLGITVPLIIYLVFS